MKRNLFQEVQWIMPNVLGSENFIIAINNLLSHLSASNSKTSHHIIIRE